MGRLLQAEVKSILKADVKGDVKASVKVNVKASMHANPIQHIPLRHFITSLVRHGALKTKKQANLMNPCFMPLKAINSIIML
jgi:hypothetical protein